MARPGRKPLALEHVDHLEGSEHAKQRMTTLLMTLEGSCTIDEARSRLNVSESRLHDLRQHWLQGALELLEPRRPGRPPRAHEASAARIDELEQQVRELERELALAQARCEVQEVMASSGALKKGPARS